MSVTAINSMLRFFAEDIFDLLVAAVGALSIEHMLEDVVLFKELHVVLFGWHFSICSSRSSMTAAEYGSHVLRSPEADEWVSGSKSFSSSVLGQLGLAHDVSFISEEVTRLLYF